MKTLLLFSVLLLAACADETKFGAPNKIGDERVELVPAATLCSKSLGCPSDQHCLDGLCVDVSESNRCDSAHVCVGGDRCAEDGVCR